jgi:hypothetical protein
LRLLFGALRIPGALRTPDLRIFTEFSLFTEGSTPFSSWLLAVNTMSFSQETNPPKFGEEDLIDYSDGELETLVPRVKIPTGAENEDEEDLFNDDDADGYEVRHHGTDDELTEEQQMDIAQNASLGTFLTDIYNREEAGPSGANPFAPLTGMDGMDVDTGEGSASRQPPAVDFDQSLTSLLDSSSWKFRGPPPPPPPQDPGVPTTEDFVEVDAEMEDEFAMTIGQCGFDFFKIPPVQKRHCWLSVNGSPWAGSFGTQANWTNHLVIDLGRMAKPKVKILVRTNKEFDGRIVASEKEGEVHDFSIQWQPGVRVGTGEKDFELMSFKVMPVTPKYNAYLKEELASRGLPVCPGVSGLPEKLRSMLVHCRIQTCSGAIRGKDRHWFAEMKTLLPPQEYSVLENLLTGDGSDIDMFFVNEDSEAWCEMANEHMGFAVEERLPPLWTLYDPGNMKATPSVNMKFPDIMEFQDGMMLKYSKAIEQMLLIGELKQKPWEDNARFREYGRGFGTWTDEREFALSYQMAIVRNQQWDEGQYWSLMGKVHHITLVKTTRPDKDGRKKEPLSEEQQEHRQHFYAYVILNKDYRGGDSQRVPKDIAWRVDFENLDRSGAQQFSNPKAMWIGTQVNVSGEKLAAMGGADFCLLLTKPKRGRRQPALDSVADCTEDSGGNAYLFPVVTPTTAKRQLAALDRFMNKSIKWLDNWRIPLVYGKEAKVSEAKDLRLGPSGEDEEAKARWLQYYIHLETDLARKFNPKILDVIKITQRVRYGMLQIFGPPGSRKTSTEAEVVVSMSIVGHTQVVCSEANGAANQAAVAVFDVFQRERQNGPFAEILKRKKLLRLLPTHAEMKELKQLEASKELKDGIAKRIGKEAWKDDPILMRILAQAQAVDDAELSELDWKGQKEELRLKAETLREEYKFIDEKDRKRGSDNSTIPREMTLHYRMMETMEEDIANPQNDRSAAFRELLEKRRTQGLDDEEDKVYASLRTSLILRIVEETDVLVTTLANFGSDMIWDANNTFDILHIDETSFATVPSALIPITANKFKAHFFYGDPKQLQPHSSARGRNEFINDIEVSFMAHLQELDMPSISLDTQYRMTPEIVEFIAGYLYPGLKNAACTMNPRHAYTMAGQRAHMALYGIRGKSGHGCEYIVIDVPHGVSTRVKHGRSLENHTEATVIGNLIVEYIAQGIPAHHIGIISFYTGQTGILSVHCDRVDGGHKITLSSADGSQGQEWPVTILNTAATGHYGYGPKKSTYYISAHVLNWHRLNVGLSRGKYVNVVVGNFGAILKSSKVKRQAGTDKPNMLEAMVVNAEARGLLAVDNMGDCNPARAGALRDSKDQAWAEELLNKANNRQWVVRLRDQKIIRPNLKSHENASFEYLHADGTTGRYPMHLIDMIRVREDAPDAVDVPGAITVADDPTAVDAALKTRLPRHQGTRGGPNNRGRGRASLNMGPRGNTGPNRGAAAGANRGRGDRGRGDRGRGDRGNRGNRGNRGQRGGPHQANWRAPPPAPPAEDTGNGKGKAPDWENGPPPAPPGGPWDSEGAAGAA